MARVFVITGPSGVGKGTLIRGLMERLPQLRLSVSATTRRPRPGEREGVDYYFLTPAEFDRHVRDGDFVEHAEYAGRSYGTLHSELESAHGEQGPESPGVAGGDPDRPVVLEIEVQGARQVRRSVPDAVQVFIAPPSLEALRTRLIGRGTDDPEEVERRLRVAEQELTAQPEFGHVVVNDRLDEALERLCAIVEDELD
jgi:guanylate kinase